MTADNAKPGKNDHLAFYMDLVGHDILNNNQAVLGYLELILANPSSDKTVKNYAEKAFSHVRTSTLLVENEKRLMATMMLDKESLRPADIRAKLERSQGELSRFFPDKRVRVRLEQIPKDARALGNSAAEELIMNAMVSAVRLDPKEEVELRVNVAEAVFRGRPCWTVTIEEPNALLPPSLKGRDIKSVYLLDSSVAVKLSGLLFSKMIAEALGGDFDAYELPDAKDHVGAGFTITLRRADKK
ncbi:MAG: hypothetical protein JW880_05850 [Candidatus Thermoplasmatota archaeon]|nr:hypothetical protein [Candidatus Thermoplasmatota archaeon]